MPRKPRRRDPQPKTAVSGDLEADASATPTLLFEKNPRTYGGRRDQLESMHAFFARYDHPTAERVRNMCQKWFERYKCDARQPDVKDLHARFLKNKDEQHYAAWFELCIHEMLARLGFSVTTHPDLPGTTHPPDFKATLAGSRAFVEATVLRRPSGGSPCVRDAAYKMLRLELENCFATITAVDGKLCRLLKRGELQREFQKRFDEAKRLYDTDGDRVPRIARIRFDDWQLTVELYPATSGRRTQGRVMPLALDEFVEPAVRDVQGKIDEKKYKYGPAAVPLILSVNVHAREFNSLDSWKEVLFDANGIWNRQHLHRSTVAGVVFFAYADNVSVPNTGACLFVNPSVDPATLPPALLRLPHALGPDGSEHHDGESVASILGLA